MLLPPFIIEPK